MKSKPEFKANSVKGTSVTSKPVAGSVLAQASKSHAGQVRLQASKTVAGSFLSQKNMENVSKYMTRTHDSFARGLAASSLDSERGALAGKTHKR
ncbi:hypothetical protein [Janthinobacterium lividum]|uniref:Uncharacterized protein n=1 Tax=Janthinobacterium lividum TaxID=29581 RepID=A0ABU0XT14_9BURK|nr:hypothetical protein [Janthinobacterium lividum]MDQ4626278.1 hypothetical protein [Janthinobacterium lividum]MDQ4674755.1 hypothetical protein [Janthinobacterium lividum]MDQ4685487.1 hypothetical protein [Janthinobacterium lividum]